MKNLSIYILFLSLLALSACSDENDFNTNTQPQSGQALILNVSASRFATDGLPDSRATDSGNTTTFETGDRVGITVLDGNDNLLADNIPYVYGDGAGWSFDSQNSENKQECYYNNKAVTYLAYYPYSSTADGITSEGALKTKFPPQHDQHTKEAYRASDLLVWTSTSTAPLKKLDIVFKHAYSLLSLSPSIKYITDGPEITLAFTSASDVNLTINSNYYLPYKEDDGSFRIIVASQESAIRWFFTDRTYTYKGAITQTAVVANTRYTLTPTIPLDYKFDKAQMGDFYCISSDGAGYLIPGEVSQKSLVGHTCLGVVLKSGRDGNGDWIDDGDYKQKGTTTEMPTINGYVLALNDANAGNQCQWSPNGANVGTNTHRYTGFRGYANTNTIKTYANNNNLSLSTDFPATYHATVGYETSHQAPDNSSGWFLPSAGQCKYWLNNRDVLLESIKKATGKVDYAWKDKYWSSSEYGSNPRDVWCLNLAYYNNNDVYNYFKTGSFSVRSVLAF